MNNQRFVQLRTIEIKEKRINVLIDDSIKTFLEYHKIDSDLSKRKGALIQIEQVLQTEKDVVFNLEYLGLFRLPEHYKPVEGLGDNIILDGSFTLTELKKPTYIRWVLRKVPK